MEFLENVSNGNIREALGYLEAYIGSPHVNLRHMLEVLEKEGASLFVIPLQDLVRSVLLGDSEFYDPRRSPVGNLFDITSPSRAEHVLCPILVEYTQTCGSELGSDGYVEFADLYDYVQPFGFSIDSISDALERAVNSRFITRSGFDRRDRRQPRAYRVAPCGVYATRKLARLFTYIDAVIDDTPIADPAFFSTLNPMSHTREIGARLRRAERFVEYLTEGWAAFVECAQQRGRHDDEEVVVT